MKSLYTLIPQMPQALMILTTNSLKRQLSEYHNLCQIFLITLQALETSQRHGNRLMSYQILKTKILQYAINT